MRGAAQVMLDADERVLSDVMWTVLAELGIYRGPVVARNTSESDFRVTDLTSKAKPMSVYLVVLPDDIELTDDLAAAELERMATLVDLGARKKLVRASRSD